MDRSSRILLRVALAVPMLYGAWSLRPVLPQTTLGVLYVSLPALGLLLGCALLVGDWRARWAWGIVAASGLWITFAFLYTYSRLFDMHGDRLLLHRFPAEAAFGVYAFILALAFIVSRHTDTTKAQVIGQ